MTTKKRATKSMRAEAIRLLACLSEGHGASGREQQVREIVARELGVGVASDKSGSVIQEQAGAAKSPRVMLCAHLDEVGFMVQSVTREGYLKFVPLGGWSSRTLPAQRVRVLTRANGELLGVIGAKPPHLLSAAEREKAPKLEDLYIDVGAASAKQAREEFGVGVGDPVVPDSAFTTMRNPDYLLGKAFDDRVGVALLIQAAQALAKKAHPNTLCCVGTVQEEVGARGAATAAAAVKPDVAIVLEGPPADDSPGANLDEAQGVLGQGPQLRLMDPSAICNAALAEFVIDLAGEIGIPHQVTVRRSGGTDAKAIQVSDTGVPTIVIGVPARYIHTHNSIIHLTDHLNALLLVTALVERLDRAAVDGFTSFT